MPVKLFLQLRLLNPALPVTCFPPMKLRPSISSSGTVSGFSRVFPFKLRYRSLPSNPAPQNHQLGLRTLSTRPFRSRTGSGSEFGRQRGEVRATSKSLIEDEAELSDWVTELRDDDSFRGRNTSEDELDGDRGGRRSRVRDGDSSYSVKRRRRGESDSDDFNDSNRGKTRTPIGSRSRDSQVNRRFDSRGDGQNGEVFARKRRPGLQEGKLSSNSSVGKRGGRDMEFGSNRNEGSKGFKKDGRDSRKQVPLLDNKEDEGTKFGIRDLLSEEDSDIDDDKEEEGEGNDNVMRKERSSYSFANAKGSAAASTGKSESYLSETRY